MATYKYRITDKFGRDKKGTLEAGSPEAATAKLKGEGAVVHSVEETTNVEDACRTLFSVDSCIILSPSITVTPAFNILLN